MKQVGIIGFGRFGKILSSILQKGFDVLAYDPEPQMEPDGIQFTSMKKVIQCDTVFICVPIRSLKDVIIRIKDQLNPKSTIIDVCSVKKYPQELMKEYLPKNIGYIATHPLFGPDSYQTNKNLKMMAYPERDVYDIYHFWKQYFSGQGIEVIQIDPDTHDKLASNSQGITHFIGRSLKEFGAKRSTIDTEGFRNLLDLVNQTCNDTWELYEDLQTYNPYTKMMIKQINEAIQIQTTKLTKDENGK